MRGSPGLSESLIGNNLNQQHLPVLSRRARHSCLGSGPPQGPVRASVQGLQARRANVAAQQCLAPARSSGPRAGETVPYSSACQSLLLQEVPRSQATLCRTLESLRKHLRVPCCLFSSLLTRILEMVQGLTKRLGMRLTLTSDPIKCNVGKLQL